MLVVTETLSLRLWSGLFDVDGEEDNEDVNDDVVHVEIEDDKVKEVVCDTFTVAEVRALPVEDEDCEGVMDVDTELLDDDDKILDIEFIIDWLTKAVTETDGEIFEELVKQVDNEGDVEIDRSEDVEMLTCTEIDSKADMEIEPELLLLALFVKEKNAVLEREVV